MIKSAYKVYQAYLKKSLMHLKNNNWAINGMQTILNTLIHKQG